MARTWIQEWTSNEIVFSQGSTANIGAVTGWENGRMISLADEVGMREDPVDSLYAYGTI